MGFASVAIDGNTVALDKLRLHLEDAAPFPPRRWTPPTRFRFRCVPWSRFRPAHRSWPRANTKSKFLSKPARSASFTSRVEDAIPTTAAGRCTFRATKPTIFSPTIIAQRQAFIEKVSGVKLHQSRAIPSTRTLAKGNCENFVGVAQVPIGFAGPLQVHGEHADGEFLIPLATSEGTLVASYNRGMKVLNLRAASSPRWWPMPCSAPRCLYLRCARGPRFRELDRCQRRAIREEAEATSSVAKLLYIDPYLANKFVYLRFNFSTGDAAGQNMVGRATFAACSWILDTYTGSTTSIWSPTSPPTRRPRR